MEQTQPTIKRKRYSAELPWTERTFRTKAAFFIGSAWTIYIICSLFHVFDLFGFVVYPLTHRAICAGALVSVTLLGMPAKRDAASGKLPWYDALMIFFVVWACCYMGVYAEKFASEWSSATPVQMVMGIGFSIALLESVRRTAGLAPVILVLVTFFYFVYSDLAPGFLMSTGFTYPDAIGWIFMSGEGYWGNIAGVAASTLPGFIFFGAILRCTGASSFFSDLSLACMGQYRGGSAKTAVLSSMFFGSLSGSVSANVATTGQITIPMMKNAGFSSEESGAVESVASTGGMFTPPIMGATAFLIADFLNVSYWVVCLGAFLPAVLYYSTLLLQVDLIAKAKGLRGQPKESLPRARDVLRAGWYYLPPFVVLVYFLGYLKYSAETSIVATVSTLLVCTLFSKSTRITWKRFLVILEDTAIGMVMVIPLCVAIGVLVGAMTVTGAGANLASELSDMSGNNIYFMLLMAGVASFILGMGMTSIACYLLTVVMLAPAIEGSGLSPLAVHLYLFYYCALSFITPPVAVAAFVASGISGGDPTRTGVLSLRMGIAGFLVPWGFITRPDLLCTGSMLDALWAFTLAIVAIYNISMGFVGYFMDKIVMPVRWFCVIIGMLSFVPLPENYQLAVFGVNLATIAVLWWHGKRTSKV